MSGNHGGSNIYEDQEQVNYGRSRVANEEKHHLTKAEGYRPSEFLTNAACLNRSADTSSTEDQNRAMNKMLEEDVRTAELFS